MKTNKTYRVPVIWQMCETLTIHAANLEDAVEIAHKLPLAPGGYVDTSFEVEEELIECWENIESDRFIQELTNAELVKLGEHFGCTSSELDFEFTNGNLQLYPNKKTGQKAILESLEREKLSSILLNGVDITALQDEVACLVLETGEVVVRVDSYLELLEICLKNRKGDE